MHIVTFERRRDSAPDDPRDSARRLGSMGDAALGLEPLDPHRPGARRLGAVIPAGPDAGAVVDLNRALAVKLAYEDVGAPEAEADSLLPTDLLRFLRRLPDSLEFARSALEFVVESIESYDAPDVRRAGLVEPRRRVRLYAPVPRPGKILAVAGNYPAHASQRGSEEPSVEPILFLKAPSAVIGPEDEIVIPAASSYVDCEGELAVVIGRAARRVPIEDALECVAGYCAASDVSARDFQEPRAQHFIGRSCDTFAPLGPSLVTADEIPDPQDLAIRTVVSGAPQQSGRTKEMRFPIARLIAFASSLMTLEPGDVLLTGTLSGVGSAQRAGRRLRDGDVVEVEIERVGRLCNYVREEPADSGR
ncbi:MAG: fumarylacetoacetate hydrolase family protein [Myxococcales bacterium]|nr:fumarylacetoacetate hydrolase family protein [Myxococcales bacterium]